VQFGISTHLYHSERLSFDHLVEIAAHSFDAIELFATRSHFDYHDPRAVATLDGWLKDIGLRLHSIHAPIAESLVNGRWGGAFSNASADRTARERAVAEAVAALEVAHRIPTGFIVVHLGVPASQQPQAGDNSRDAARHSLEQIYEAASPLGVGVAAEVIPNDLSAPTSLVHMLEEEVELPGAGICLDLGHAQMMGDLLDAIETVAEHLVTTHVHDNRGRTDEHLPPFAGTIDWAAVMMELQKVGYDGTLMLELAGTSTPRQALEMGRQACDRFSELLAIR